MLILFFLKTMFENFNVMQRGHRKLKDFTKYCSFAECGAGSSISVSYFGLIGNFLQFSAFISLNKGICDPNVALHWRRGGERSSTSVSYFGLTWAADLKKYLNRFFYFAAHVTPLGVGFFITVEHLGRLVFQ